jgi:hypothetical protein
LEVSSLKTDKLEILSANGDYKVFSPSTGDISETVVSFTNQITTAVPVPGLFFDSTQSRSFNVMLTVERYAAAGDSLFAQFTLKGIKTETGWVINSEFIGNSVHLVFDINSSGQITIEKAKSTNTLEYTELKLIFRAITNGTYPV